ncbi:acyl-CoA thioesterase [Streptosporangium sp. NPDC087985]|uniref:acyl-CoA thioesterase n=1 Tax=Streptosporangium sp. NPDC087985 TaxID=3366196 RepID=UPI00381552F6
MTTPLTEALELRSTGTDAFTGRVPPTELRQVYGGHLVGQAALAARTTVSPGRRLHSLQTYFLRPGRNDAELEYRIRRIRDGASSCTRLVKIRQGGVQIAQVSASFTSFEALELSYQVPMPTAPPPEALPTLHQRVTDHPDDWPLLYRTWRHFDVRYVEAPRDRLSGSTNGPRTSAQVWLRADEPQPDDPGWHECALAYVSDLTLLSVVLPAMSLRPALPGLRMASLDHMLWFHQPCRVDGWILYDQSTHAVGGGLGLASGHLFQQDGTLLATVMQQGVIRRPDGC